MKTYHRSLLLLTLLLCSTTLFAQDNKAAASALIKEGVGLNDAGKYAEALTKYDEALKFDPNNTTAIFEKAYTLSAAGRADEAIPYFEKVITETKDPNAYVGLGNIYDVKGDYQKAIDYYLKGIAVSPKNNSLWFNLSVSYSRQKKYDQSESAAAEAIKGNMRHANSYRNYAVAAYQQGKSAEAVLGLCNYLTFGVPPQQARGAIEIVRTILKTNPDAKATGVAKLEQQTVYTSAAEAVAGKTNLTAMDSLTLQLTAVFKAIKKQQDQYGSVFFSKYFGNYFGDIAETNYMDVFTHFIGISLNPAENLVWLKARPDNIKEFNTWSNTQRRQTE